MGLILVGILLCALIIGLSFLLLSKGSIKDFGAELLYLLAAVCLITGAFAGITAPVNGYGEPEIVSTTELVSLKDETISEASGRLFYVSISGTNSYTYYVEIDSQYASNSQKAYKSNTISNSNVTIIEDNNYTDAKLVTYVRYGKKTFWTFAAKTEQYEYVFYVPTGTIARNVSLG